MEERLISTGASCFLIKDESLKQGWHSFIYEWLKSEGFITWGRKGTFYTDWIYINILSKVYAPGWPGVGITQVVGDHAITFEEFKIIYDIFKKYEGFSTLKMNAQEQKEFEEYCADIEAKPHPIEAYMYKPDDIKEYKEKVRECLINIHKCSSERADKLMLKYEDDFQEAFYAFEWDINVIAGAIVSGLW